MQIKTSDLLVRITCLILIALLAHFVDFFLLSEFKFSLTLRHSPEIWNSISLLPLLLIGIVILKVTSHRLRVNSALINFGYIAIFLLISPKLSLGLVFMTLLITIFYLERWTRPKSILSSLFFILIFVLSLIPLVIYEMKTSLRPLHLYTLLVFKSCLMMRIISWAIDRRIYKRTSYDHIQDFIEFIFCPIFFIFPGQIQFFLYDYFHKHKSHTLNPVRPIHILTMATWGMICMVLYSIFDTLFWSNYARIPAIDLQPSNWIIHLGIGLYWLILIYFQQAGGMAFQISLGRILGYQFKYDMHTPLLARSPLDYMRRHSSYVKDYIVEMGLRPISLLLLRKGFRSNTVFALAASFSYALFISLQTGYRPDFHRPWPVTLSMILFLTIFIFLPVIWTYLKSKLGMELKQPDNLLKEAQQKSIREWTVKDFGLWILTILLLSLYKAILGLSRSW